MYRLLVALTACALLAACAPTTDILRTSEELHPPKPAHSVLVVGVTTDEKIRRTYEQAFLAELQHAGLAGTASSDLLPSLGGLSMPQLRERMQAFSDRADTVLHVQLMNLVQERTMSPQDVPADSAPAKRRIGGVDVTLNAPPGGESAGTQTSVQLESNLYSLPERRLLWTGITATHEANNPSSVARSHARALIAELRRRGYLATKP